MVCLYFFFFLPAVIFLTANVSYVCMYVSMYVCVYVCTGVAGLDPSLHNCQFGVQKKKKKKINLVLFFPQLPSWNVGVKALEMK